MVGKHTLFANHATALSLSLSIHCFKISHSSFSSIFDECDFYCFLFVCTEHLTLFFGCHPLVNVNPPLMFCLNPNAFFVLRIADYWVSLVLALVTTRGMFILWNQMSGLQCICPICSWFSSIRRSHQIVQPSGENI
jgi:hypothetical protein